MEQGCVLRGSRVVIPAEGRKAVMDVLHKGHPGGTKMKALARSFVWWPGMNDDLESIVNECNQCQLTCHSPPQAPLHPWNFPASPWERLHADFAGPFLGQMYLIVVDAFSKWLEVVPLSSATSLNTVDSLRNIFATHGLPKMLVSDNGPQFTSSEFQAFMRNNGIKHICSSPYHPSTNGLAERAVQSFKEHMKCLSGSISQRLAAFLFWYRLTPHSTTGVAPAELLLRRRPISKLDLIKPDLSGTVHSKIEAQKRNHDATVKLRVFAAKDNVYVKDFPNTKKWIPGKVREIRGPLSILVELMDGCVVRRHVDALRPCALLPDQNTGNTGLPALGTDIEIPNPGINPAAIGDSQANDETPSRSGSDREQSTEQSSVSLPRRTSSRQRAPPDRYGFST